MEISIIVLTIILILGIIVAYFIGKKIGGLRKKIELDKQIPLIREDAVIRSRAVLGGQFSEQLAPYLPDFRYNPLDCRFIGKPVDFIVFRGMNEKGIVEIIFLEVKSGEARLSLTEKQVKDAIDSGRVKFEEYRIPKELTGKKD